MSASEEHGGQPGATLSLVVRRTIAASAQFLFDAWTQPALLVRWWGPAGVSCPEAHVDLRAGGSLRIANRFPDGRTVWIHGTFERVEPPHLLVYSWQIEQELGSDSNFRKEAGSNSKLESDPNSCIERVSVRFEPRGPAACEVIVVHERIPDARTREQHAAGWDGCLDGLERLVES